MRGSITLLTSFVRVLTLARAQTAVRRFNHAALVVGDWLYVDGGKDISATGEYKRQNETLGIDLSSDWTNSSLNIIATGRPNNSQPMNFESLWWSLKDNMIYSFGGERFLVSVTLPESIWGFKPDGIGGGEWIEMLGPTSDKPFPPHILRPAAGASAFDSDGAYYLGGFASIGTSNAINLEWGTTRPVPGLLTFDFSSRTLKNSTNDGGYFASVYRDDNWSPSGCMLNVPSFGSRGILLLIGGKDSTEISGGGDFNNLTIFDKEGQKWYSQTASGSIPEPKSSFCAVGNQGGDNSTYEIFVYGGQPNGQGSSTVAAPAQIHILSLPAFRWFQVKDTAVPPRAGHQCVATGSNQVISIGGVDPGESQNVTADPWTQGIGVFDMSSLIWKESYQSKADPYQPADMIKQYYNLKNSRYPSSWTSSEVQSLFQVRANGNSSTSPSPTNSLINPSSSSAPAATSPQSSFRPGMIAGIVVGCAVGLLAALLGFWLLLRHRKNIRSWLTAGYAVHEPTPHLNELPQGDMASTQSVVELQATEPIHELNMDRGAWELPVVERPVEKAT